MDRIRKTEIFTYILTKNSSVKQEALEGENVILTVAPGVVLEVTSGIDGMIVKETVHEDGSKNI